MRWEFLHWLYMIGPWGWASPPPRAGKLRGVESQALWAAPGALGGRGWERWGSLHSSPVPTGGGGDWLLPLFNPSELH